MNAFNGKSLGKQSSKRCFCPPHLGLLPPACSQSPAFCLIAPISTSTTISLPLSTSLSLCQRSHDGGSGGHSRRRAGLREEACLGRGSILPASQGKGLLSTFLVLAQLAVPNSCMPIFCRSLHYKRLNQAKKAVKQREGKENRRVQHCSDKWPNIATEVYERKQFPSTHLHC